MVKIDSGSSSGYSEKKIFMTKKHNIISTGKEHHIEGKIEISEKKVRVRKNKTPSMLNTMIKSMEIIKNKI